MGKVVWGQILDNPLTIDSGYFDIIAVFQTGKNQCYQYILFD